jgi:hypothetical protein
MNKVYNTYQGCRRLPFCRFFFAVFAVAAYFEKKTANSLFFYYL